MDKDHIIANYKYVLLDESGKHFQYLKDDEEFNRLLDEGAIGDGDVIITLIAENIKVAKKIDKIQVK